MRAQVTVTVDEAKALIARAIARMPRVARAAQEGLVVLHPSSSAWHVAQCLTGEAVSTPVVVCGMVVPKGTSGGAATKLSPGAMTWPLAVMPAA